MVIMSSNGSNEELSQHASLTYKQQINTKKYLRVVEIIFCSKNKHLVLSIRITKLHSGYIFYIYYIFIYLYVYHLKTLEFLYF